MEDQLQIQEIQLQEGSEIPQEQMVSIEEAWESMSLNTDICMIKLRIVKTKSSAIQTTTTTCSRRVWSWLR
jgi:hypothetical protein